MVVLLFACGALAAISAGAPRALAAPGSPPAADEPDRAVPNFNVTQRDDARLIVELSGLGRSRLGALEKAGITPDRWRTILAVRVLGPGGEDVPPLAGTYRVVGDALRFESRFPMEPGIRYRAVFHEHAIPDASGGIKGPSFEKSTVSAEFGLPARPAREPTATVTAVYPTRAVLPENLLRFYIHFSAPMSRGEAYRHIRLLDADGRPIADPFLEIDEELWSGDGKRFTLLFDPGRIKRGLKPREEVGPVLMAGRSYELVVEPGWRDAGGRPLKSGFRKAFRAVAADERSPDPKTWAVRPPAPETRGPLEVRFPEPLDRALLDRLIVVRDPDDRPVGGSVSVSDEETVWRFTPEVPWRAGDYRLVIGTELEDVAGNSVARPFEVDEVGPVTRRIVGETVALPFRIGAASR